MKTKPKWELVPALDCSEEILTGCFKVLSAHFDGVTESDFRSDLAEKESVAILKGDVVHGFSTLVTLKIEVGGEVKNVVFSGDTAVDPLYRNQFGLGKCLGQYSIAKLEQLAGTDLWYVLISKGWGTYKATNFLFENFTPSPSFFDPEFISIGKAFVARKYPERILEREEVLVALNDSQRLKAGSADVSVPGTDLGRYFIDHNPDYLRGDELVCVAKVSHDNFTPQFKRVLGVK
jgi:hypothetical protein